MAANEPPNTLPPTHRTPVVADSAVALADTHRTPETTGLSLQPGQRPLPEYELVRRLGRGGFGEVWQATAPGGFDIALKFLPLGEQAAQVELRSLEVMKHVRHAHLLPLFGAWQRDEHLIIAMELADGTLHDRWKAARSRGLPGLPPAELLAAMREAALGIDGLNELHHIQHKDIKPQNLLLVGGSVKVADFGLAKLLEHTVTSASGSMTPAYAPPEFFNGQATRWSDQYSLAVTYCQLRSGRLPFEGSPAQVMTGHVARPPNLTILPEAERAAVARALAKQPEQRWPSCHDFVGALAAVLEGHATAAAVLDSDTHSPTLALLASAAVPHRKRKLLAAVAGVVVLAAVALLWPARKAPPTDDGGDFPTPEPATTAARESAAATTAPAVANAGAAPGIDRTAQARAVAAVIKLGGDVEIDRDQPGRPVVAVDLARTAVTGDELAALLQAFPRLTKLDLHSCLRIGDADLPALRAATGLRTLTLSRTLVSDAGLAQLKMLTRLEELRLYACRVGDAGLAELRGLTGLQLLNLSGTSVTDAGLVHLAALSCLRTLDVSTTAVSDGGLASLEALPRLEGLDLTHTRVTDRGIRLLAALPRLQTLDLTGLPITAAGLAACKGLPNLQTLVLTGTKVDDAAMKTLAGLKQLRQVSLAGTAITDHGLMELQALPQLHDLSLVACKQVSPAGVDALHNGRPTLRIQR